MIWYRCNTMSFDKSVQQQCAKAVVPIWQKYSGIVEGIKSGETIDTYIYWTCVDIDNWIYWGKSKESFVRDLTYIYGKVDIRDVQLQLGEL